MSNTLLTVEQIPLAQLMPNPENPGGSLSPELIQAMAESLKEMGQKTTAKVRPLTTEEKAKYTPCEYMIVGGHLRFEGAKLAGFATLRAEVLNMAPDEVELEAYMDNQLRERTWLEKDLFIARQAKNPNVSQRQLATKLMVTQNKVYTAVKIANALTSAVIALINENLQKTLISDERNPFTKNKGFLITEYLILTLADLGNAEAVEKALKVVCDELMPVAEAKKLVEHIQAGNPAESYTASAKAPKRAKSALPPELASQVVELPALKTDAPTPHASSQPHPAKPNPASSESSPQQMGTVETVALDTLAGVSIIAKIKTKLKKGEKPTLAETLLLAAHALWKATAWLGKHGFKLVKWLVKETWKLSKASLKGTVKGLGPAIARKVGFVFNIAIVCLFVWVIWDIHEHGLMHPVHTVGSFFRSKTSEAPHADAPKQPAQPGLAAQPEKSAAAKTSQDASAQAPAPIAVAAKHKKAQVTSNQMPMTSSAVQATPVQKGPDVLGDVAKGAGAVGGVAKLFGL